ncbi:MAG TPA: GNAT family N-acetyltransferase [Actinomycetota bacterium]|nr:GNAT family N-acetyltransferase [Actinomycetota bacterium]
MTVVVRPAGADDLPGVLRLLADLPVTTGEGDSFEVDEQRAEVVWERVLSQEGRTVLVAMDGLAIVGAADLLVVQNLTHDLAPWAIIENVAVAPSDRRKGVGRALVDEAVGIARDAGCYKVQLLSFKDRLEAHEFYRSLGFEDLAVGFRIYF